MARRITKAEASLWTLLIVIGLPLFAVVKFFEAAGFVLPAIVLALGIAGYVWHRLSTRKERLRLLTAKYQDAEIVEKIMNGYIWQGQTAEQLKDAVGEPAAVDRQIMKTKRKEIWKYGRQSRNRFNLRVTVENDFVVGWDKKA